MKIKLTFEQLESAMSVVSSVVADRLLRDELKNAIIWIKEGQVRFAGYNNKVTSATLVEAICEGVDLSTDHFIQLRAKDITDVLDSFKGLKRTVVTDVEFEISETEAIMSVKEEPIDPDMDNAERYNQTSKFRIAKTKAKDIVITELNKLSIDVQGVEVDTGSLLAYIVTLYPTVAKEKRESTSYVMFGDEYVYTMVATHSSIMTNKLPDVFKGLRLQNSQLSFLKSLIEGETSISVSKNILDNGVVLLTLRVGDSVVEIKCPDMSRAFDITNYVDSPSNGVVVDKIYLIDVLKRIGIGNEESNIEIKINGGFGEMKVASKAMTQDIPVNMAKGEGEYLFSIRAELLSNIIFSHVPDFGENVYFYVDKNENGSIVLSCKDNSDLWHTKITSLSPSRTDFSWSQSTVNV